MPTLADPKASDSGASAQMNFSDSGLITLGKRLAEKKLVIAPQQLPSKRAKRESDENLEKQPTMTMSMAQHDTFNQDAVDKLNDNKARSHFDNLQKAEPPLESKDRLEATETEKSDLFDRELEDGEEDDDSEKRRERR